MTGIAQGLTDITKIALGGAEVIKVSLGDELVWPTTVGVIHEDYPALPMGALGLTYSFGQVWGVIGVDPSAPLIEGIYPYDFNGSFYPFNNPTVWNGQLAGAPISYEMAVVDSGAPEPTTGWLDGQASDLFDQAPSRAVGDATAGNCDLYVRNKLDQAIVKVLHFGAPSGSPVFTPMSNALVEASDNDSNSISSRLTFYSNGGTTPSVVGGTMVASGVSNWFGGPPLPPALSVRINRTATGVGSNVVNKNNGGAINLNTWIDFYEAGGFYCNLQNTGSGAYSRTSSYTVEFSTNGGASVSSTSTFRLRTVKQ